MRDWNVVISVKNRGFRPVLEIMEELGTIEKTDFFNILVMKVADTHRFMETVREWITDDPHLLNLTGRIIPVTETFNFQSPEEFREKVYGAAENFAGTLAGKRFHVRIHRRGFKGKISSQKEEIFLDEMLIEKTRQQGREAEISFEDPDAIVDVETVGGRGGTSLWTREDMKRYPFLHLD